MRAVIANFPLELPGLKFIQLIYPPGTLKPMVRVSNRSHLINAKRSSHDVTVAEPKYVAETSPPGVSVNKG